ncbi:MAG: FTR1 family protein [Candidatus Pacebacteria bacterium]|nr:FTR1 family protein [Candidatus Paceibacterota bacterium]
MVATLIIVLREMIEAGLIIGIVMAATRLVPRRGLWITYGVVGGVVGACLIAAFASTIGESLAGMGQEYFNATILLTAVVMLGWHSVWMASHGRQMASELKQVGAAVTAGTRSLAAMAVVVGLAVLREGAEVVLFIYGILATGTSDKAAMVSGGLLGLAGGAVISALLYFGLLSIPTRQMFRVTGWMIILLAAGMASQAVLYLQQAGTIAILTDTVWDSSAIVSDASLVGKLLGTLIGYTDQPNGMQLLAYGATLGILAVLMAVFGREHRDHLPKSVRGV